MKQSTNVHRTITMIAATVAVIAALVIPSLYFFTAYRYESIRLTDASALAAAQLSERYHFYPDTWKFEVDRHAKRIQQAYRTEFPVRYQVFDNELGLLFTTGSEPTSPIFSAEQEITNGISSGGKVVVARSMRPILFGTAIAMFVGIVLGLAMFVALRVLPLRALTRAQAELRKINEELEGRVEKRTADLREAQDALVRNERLATIGRVTATVSHELRNPLGAIRSATDALQKIVGEGTPQMHRALSLLERSQIRCDKIISDLLNFARVRELNRMPIRYDEWLNAQLDEYDFPAGLSLECNISTGANVKIDVHRMERAVRNVIDNACQAIAGEAEETGELGLGHLVVTSTCRNGRLETSFRDSGSGITSEALERIFEPLFSTKTYGFGLGLPMIKQILEQHGGGVEIESKPECGTTVILWLPEPDA